MTNCNCNLAKNLFCQTIGNISTAFPECQIVPGNEENYINPSTIMMGTSNTEPFSFWNYKFIIGCLDGPTDVPEEIYIPIYKNIPKESIQVFERILTCVSFKEIDFTIETPESIPSIENFSFIKIKVEDRYRNATSVIFSIKIVNEYPIELKPIHLRDEEGNIISFSPEFPAAGEPLVPGITVVKESEVVLLNNQENINYKINISNTGNSDLKNVIVKDDINYDGDEISLSPLEISNNQIESSSPEKGILRISGTIGDIEVGGLVTLEYTIPIANFNAPSIYTFNSITKAQSDLVESIVNTTETIEVLSLESDINCSMSGGATGVLNIRVSSIGESPDTDVKIHGIITIPSEVTLRFENFGGFTVVDNSNKKNISLNSNLSNIQVEYFGSSKIPQGMELLYPIKFKILSSRSINKSSNIQCLLNSIELTSETNQLLLLAPSPKTSNIEVSINSTITNQCK